MSSAFSRVPSSLFDFNTDMLYSINSSVQSDHYKLIRKIGAASTILLKNTNGALPLKVKNLKREFVVEA
jgi:beta-glucosidase